MCFESAQGQNARQLSLASLLCKTLHIPSGSRRKKLNLASLSFGMGFALILTRSAESNVLLDLRIKAMKTALLVASLLLTTAALGQSIGSAVGSPFMSSSYNTITHDQHASYRPMAQEQNLNGGGNSVVVAEGEIPLAEVPLPPRHEMPLGDVARLVRKERETAKKAAFVFEQQGN
jgi:hypothetical protein